MLEKEIELFPHNESAYCALCKGLEEYPLAFIEHATGTGKSFILLKYLYTKMRNNRILFISMHDEMFEQLFNEQMGILGIDKSDFNTFDTMIYHNLPKYNMRELAKKYDCIVFDEAHHCGATKWGEKIKELKEIVLETPHKQMIGTTATSIRYLDKYMDVAQVFFDNRVVSRLPISTSILENILPAPIYINSAFSLKENVHRIRKKINKVPLTVEINVLKNKVDEIDEKITSDNGVNNLLKTYNVQPGEKYIIFCKDLEDLEQKKKEAENWFKDIGPIKKFEAHSNQKKEINKEQIKDFSQNREEISLMFAVDIFNEGFHINNLDGILMFRNTKSPIVYFQQLGRALSFSARKKQIKIFDFANNLSASDIVYELYKDIIKEAKERIKTNPGKNTLYQTILSRFKIIDYTTSVIDDLNAIEKLIDEKYLIKNSIESAILKLEEYRHYYPRDNFVEEYFNNRISRDYIHAYNYICKNSEYLTLTNIERLYALNIDFGEEINMSKQKRLLLLQGNNTFHELREKQLSNFINTYINFCIENNRRPTRENDLSETELYDEYRYYLERLPKGKLTKLLNKMPFNLNLEEEILTGNHPNKELIVNYLNFINKKIECGNKLDNIEIKVLRKIKDIFILNESLEKYISKVSDVDLKIEQAIEVISNYKNNKIFDLQELFKAIDLIDKYSKRITTPQFEKLLKLSVTLPKSIDMSLEQRLKILGKFNSFYEKEQSENKNVIDLYIEFVQKSGRRPEDFNKEELYLKEAYDIFVEKTSVPKLKKICDVLKVYGIKLNFYEKSITGMPVEKSEIDNFLYNIRKKITNNDILTIKEVKVLSALNRFQDVSINKDLELIYLIGNTYYKLTDCIQKLRMKEYLSSRELYFIRQNYKFITKGILNQLKETGIKFSEHLSEEIYSLGDELCIFEKEQNIHKNRIEVIKQYIFEKKEIPRNELNKEYRCLLYQLNGKQLKEFLNFIVLNGVSLGVEESILSGIATPENVKQYLQNVKLKIKNEGLDLLEKKILKLLNKNDLLRLHKNFGDQIIQEPTTITQKIMDDIRCKIHENPSQKIDFDSQLIRLPLNEQKRLEIYRINTLATRVFNNIIKMIKEEKKSLDSLSNQVYVDEFKMLSKNNHLSQQNLYLLNEIKSLEQKYKLKEQNITKQKVIDDYINFIINNIYVIPNINSNDELERKIASDFEQVKKYLTEADIKKIDKSIKDNLTISVNNFYNVYIRFIQTNGRFPCGNSPDSEEVYLNKIATLFSEKLNAEQKKKIQSLRRLYGRATIEANLNFSKNTRKL